MRAPTVEELQAILDSKEHYSIITNKDGSISAVLSDTLKPTVTIADLEGMTHSHNIEPDGRVTLKDKTNLAEGGSVTDVMRCADCKHWGCANVCLGWETNKFGECTNPIMEIEIEGDAYIKSRTTDENAYCSNFQKRNA
jgi:hypothetical protein